MIFYFILSLLVYRELSCRGGEILRIAVLKLTAVNVKVAEAEGIEEIIRTQLSGSIDFDIVERSQIAQVLEEQYFDQTAAVDPSAVSIIGKMLGATYVIIGSVIGSGEGYIINVRLVETETAKSEMGFSEIVPLKANLLEKCMPLCAKIKVGLLQPRYKASSCFDYIRNGPEKALDGDFLSTWMAAANNTRGWIEIEYGAPVGWSSLEMYCSQPEFARGMPREFSVEYFSDNQWKSVLEVAGNRSGQWRGVFPKTYSRKWRIRIESVINTREPLQIAEIIFH